MSSDVTGKGKCLCGNVQFECTAPPHWSLYCHCESCRLNTASPATAFFGMKDGKWRWTGANPNLFESSPGVRRYFCGTCGTPMAFEADKFPGEIHFYTVALDDKTGFEPTGHVHTAERLDWFDIHDDLPRWKTNMGSDG